jgi:fructose-bisphosphate aldolase class 1
MGIDRDRARSRRVSDGIFAGFSLPSRGCIKATAHAQARYAALCQKAGLVPVMKPEVLMDGEHTLMLRRGYPAAMEKT